MLKEKADLRSVGFMLAITSLLVFQWNSENFNPLIYILYMFLMPTVTTMVHNHSHTKMWNSKPLNQLTDYWQSFFYGYPVFAWECTHIRNHHVYSNKEKDYSRTSLVGDKNNLWTILRYPMATGKIQTAANYHYMKKLWIENRKKFYYYLTQALVLITLNATLLVLDWQKALVYAIIPQQFALAVVLWFNYWQHIHLDENTKWNGSRNFMNRFLNFFLLNNGLHTIHHIKPNAHWSKAYEGHAEIAHNIDPHCNEKGLSWFLFRTYILSIFAPRFGTTQWREEAKAETLAA